MIRSSHRLPVRFGVKVIAVVLVGLVSLPVDGQETESNPTADGPGQTLELFGLDESTLRQFTDNSPLIADEYEPGNKAALNASNAKSPAKKSLTEVFAAYAAAIFPRLKLLIKSVEVRLHFFKAAKRLC